MVDVRICPRCRSENVGLTSHLLSVFAGVNEYRCKKCGFASKVFPVREARDE